MVRITADEIRPILDEITADFDDPKIETFISTANTFVNTHLGDKNISEAVLREIERWLTAHFVSCLERQAIKEKAGPAEQEFSDIFGEFLMSSTYGQTAIGLDPTGTLLEIAQGKKPVKLIAISEQ